jgi:hypothetical protein
MTKKLILILIASFTLLNIHTRAQGQSRDTEEKRFLRLCRNSPLAFYHGKQSKEFMLLMNLARLDTALLRRYVAQKYGADVNLKLPWKAMRPISRDADKRKALLRPSFGLHISAATHAITSGISGHVGHAHLNSRLALGFNLNCFLSGIASGENCDYGNRNAIDIFVHLMNSRGHRENIQDPRYMRVGLSRKWHRQYQYNAVSVFSGAKLQDRIFGRPKKI